MLCRRTDILRYLIGNMAAVSCQKHYCYSTSVSLHHASTIRLCCQQQHWLNERFDICLRHICRLNIFLHMTNFSAIGKCTELFALSRNRGLYASNGTKNLKCQKIIENFRLTREFPADWSCLEIKWFWFDLHRVLSTGWKIQFWYFQNISDWKSTYFLIYLISKRLCLKKKSVLIFREWFKIKLFSDLPQI